tara:strand:- start:28703 stop:29500 length:798 start_codon:yes stop_codon:yes gene_type:complete
MKEKIKQICQDLEKKHNIKILFAIENGSRAWRMESEDSDYDVRFVFVRPIEDYIQINKQREVINIAFDEEGKICDAKGAYIDISGFDVFKYIKLLSDSNPTSIEWLNTDILYYGEQNKVFKKFALENFSKIALYHHYKSMCRNNYLKYLKDSSDVTYKRYLYGFRGLINSRWIANKKTIPPISFPETIKKSKEFIDKEIIEKLEEIINLKSQGKEKDIIQNIVKMDKYIEEFLKDDSEAPKEKSHATLNELNDELRRIVLENGKN